MTARPLFRTAGETSVNSSSITTPIRILVTQTTACTFGYRYDPRTQLTAFKHDVRQVI